MEQNNITPEQAIQILDRATGSLQISRQDHQTIMQALQVLAGLLPKEEKTGD